MTGTARIMHRNVAPFCSITATSFEPLLAPDLLKSYDLGMVWRTAFGTTTAALIIDQGQPQIVNSVMLLATNSNAATSFRVRVSTSDPTGAAGEGWDSGVMFAKVDPAYANFIYYMDAAASGRYVRIDIVEPALSFIEAGCLILGAFWDPSVAFGFGWQGGYSDTDEIVRTRGGNEFIAEGASYRTLTGAFPALTKAERDTELAHIETVVKRRIPIAFSLDRASANLSKDTIVGRLQDVPVFTNVDNNYYQWSFNIAEIV